MAAIFLSIVKIWLKDRMKNRCRSVPKQQFLVQIFDAEIRRYLLLYEYSINFK